MVASRRDFVPAAAWTRENAAEAARRMTARYESEEFQAIFRQIESDIAIHHRPAEAHIELPPLSAPFDQTNVTIEQPVPDDIPSIARLIESADLPPFFIEEFLPGFVIARHNDDLIACGGVEIYDDTCFIRSIVVRPEARGTRLGRRLAELLMDAGRAAGAHDAYLFTMDAWAFWKHLDFVDIDVEAWKPVACQTWQYRFVAPRMHLFEGIHSMWKSLDD